MADKRRSFVVIGLGAFGSSVANALARLENYVTGIDIDDKRAALMSDALSQTLILDAREEEALREAGIDQHDVAIVAIGDNIEASILIAMNLRLLGLEKIWAKAAGRTHHRILTRVGVDRVIESENEMGQHIAQMLHNPAMRDYLSLGNGFHVVIIDAPESLAGETIGALKLSEKFGLRALGLMRGGTFHDCADEAAALEKDDKLLILGKPPELRRFGDTI
ncbi:TrkA family potassium uptake protein [Pikeienuella sp. HZG-20]|uniref:potassium channel family protein n=1 Tax=Paludibacillus litoralis TaxID=3133267 RepID=UPI0030EBFB4E